MELAICLGVLVIVNVALNELREWRFNEKMREGLVHIKRLRLGLASWSTDNAKTTELIRELREHQPDLSDLAEIKSLLQDIKQQQAEILKEAETVAKYRAENMGGYDMIEGSI